MYNARIWFNSTILERRKEFEIHCDAVKAQQKNLQQSNQIQRKQSKQHKFRCCKDLKIGTLNVRGCNHLTKRELFDDIVKKNHYDVFLVTETNVNSYNWEK